MRNTHHRAFCIVVIIPVYNANTAARYIGRQNTRKGYSYIIYTQVGVLGASANLKVFLPHVTRLGVLDGHDDTGGQDDLLPGLADVEDVDAILFYIIKKRV